MKNLSTAVTNIILFDEFKNILKGLKEIGISPIILKGAALAETVYPDISMRPMSDIDILIKEEEIEKINTCLLSHGYSLQVGGELHFIKNGNFPVNIDVHYEIWYMPESTLRNLWHNSHAVNISGEEALVMPPEEALIYTAAHTSIQHGMLSPTALEDISHITRFYQDAMSWDEVVRKAKEYQIHVPIYYTFYKAKSSNGAFIPDYVLKSLKPSYISNFFESILYKSILNSPPIFNIGHILRPLSQRGIRVKLIFLSHFIFPPRDFIVRRYNVSNPTIILIYQLLRPFLLLIELTKVLINGFKNTSIPFLRKLKYYSNIILLTRIFLASFYILLARAHSLIPLANPELKGYGFKNNDREKLTRYVSLCVYIQSILGIKYTCLTYSILLCRILRQHGFDVNINFGVKKEDGNMLGHCWVTGENDRIPTDYEVVLNYPQSNPVIINTALG